ncbi:Signal transduction histidine kinase [Klenkia soli]|uniref:histidine kinase n=1 Tax=Klenkia soli TaxID=1052260 RepID=A0A1H0IPI3_9ACTN|nr:histidine kinase [Klenkia soli]SDO33347.1 Signal transduction histidine kinase [Klenkia soli]
MWPLLTRVNRWAGAHPRVVDVLLALAALGAALGGLVDGGGRGRGGGAGGGFGTGGAGTFSAGAVVLLVLAAAVLLARRSHPVPVAVVSAGAVVGAVLMGGADPLVSAPLLLALFTLGWLASLRTTVLTVVIAGVGYVLALAAAQGVFLDERGDSPALTVLALGGAAAAAGVALRGQRSALVAARARAAQAESTREEEAQRRVTDERLRIARELHDVVAHHIAVVNVQAGVARHLLHRDPDKAEHALTLVREASKSVLTELTAVVGLLRTDGGDGPAAPAPGLSRLSALVDDVRSAGLALEWQVTGQPADLPAVADLTAYRVVQEALTNAVKYGDGQATLLVDHGAGEVTIDVVNGFSPRPPSGTGGHGLIGMRERIDAAHGQLDAGPDGAGHWRVRAVVPRGIA